MLFGKYASEKDHQLSWKLDMMLECFIDLGAVGEIKEIRIMCIIGDIIIWEIDLKRLRGMGSSGELYLDLLI